MEGARLQVPDVDGARKLLHIHGKRGKDRYVPLPDATLAVLREHWRTHRNPLWLFPTITRSHSGVAQRSRRRPHFSRQSPERVQPRRQGQRHSTRRARPHPPPPLCHHLLEAGVNLRLIQEYLGPHQPENHRHLHPPHARAPRRRAPSHQCLTLPVNAFITRFLQHVLPRGFTKVRSYGLLSPGRRVQLERARDLLELHARDAVVKPYFTALHLPHCHGRRMIPARGPAKPRPVNAGATAHTAPPSLARGWPRARPPAGAPPATRPPLRRADSTPPQVTPPLETPGRLTQDPEQDPPAA